MSGRRNERTGSHRSYLDSERRWLGGDSHPKEPGSYQDDLPGESIHASNLFPEAVSARQLGLDPAVVARLVTDWRCWGAKCGTDGL
nr:hypothetical protein CFP56_57840 [Quercus suber]